MGMYASVRGWLETDSQQRAAAEDVIRRHDDGFYSGGWAFPAAPFNWTLYLFYGGDVREGELPWLREQVAELAALAPVDADGDRPAGFFLITDERRHTRAWEVRDGVVADRAAPELAWFARE